MNLAADQVRFFDGITGGNGWVIRSIIILAVTLGLSYLEKIFFNRLLPKYKRSGKIWDTALINAFHRPLNVLIWYVGIILTIKELAVSLDITFILDIIKETRDLGIVTIAVWFLISFIREIEGKFIRSKSKEHLDKTMIKGMGLLFRITVLILAVLILLPLVFKVPLSGVVALGGLSGVFVGFASKDLLANVFGGMVIFLDRPFAIGDWIRSPDREIEGYVEDIGWRLTKILTLEKRPLYVPNAIFSTIAIENPSRMLCRRVIANVAIRYRDAKKLPKILSDIREMMEAHPDINHSHFMTVNLTAFTPSALELTLHFFTVATKLVEFRKAQENVFLKVLDIVHANNAECAYPTTTLHVPDELDIPVEKLLKKVSKRKKSET